MSMPRLGYCPVNRAGTSPATRGSATPTWAAASGLRGHRHWTGLATRALLPLAAAVLTVSPFARAASGSLPVVTGISRASAELVVSATIPAGFHHAILESAGRLITTGDVLVAGPLTGGPAVVTFHIPDPGSTVFLRVRVGTGDTVPAARYSGLPYFLVENGGAPPPLTPDQQAGHVLSRLAYGPTTRDLQAVRVMGARAYIDQQLHPEILDESDNEALKLAEAGLFTMYQPADETHWIRTGDTWRYFKGTQAPPAAWKSATFDDAGWLAGPSGVGYGDDDDATVLEDMRQTADQPGYLTVYLRRHFPYDPAEVADALVLRIDFDDGFVAYLNGVEVARENVTGNPPAFNRAASADHEAGQPVDLDLSSYRALLRAGDNVLSIEVHNVNLTSSDLTMIPELIARKFRPVPPVTRIRGIEELQQLAHVRGIYSRRQLQQVLGEFWENHFTTDYDKVAAHLGSLRNSDAQPAMTGAQAAAEAAQAEYLEYQFFVDHALGNFGDLLLFSATSPTQLIYLDNVLNVKEAPNENYAREVLELFAFGVDNRYTQTDIEQLARCFTGWSIRKVRPEDRQPFPASARNPPTEESVQFTDSVLLDLGPGWRYFKGTREPSPDPAGLPTAGWTEPGFDDAGWLPGSTGIGYGDDDDATVLPDMRNRYVSVYLRREFEVADPSRLGNLLLSVDYDDGYVAYLNGVEIARSATMRNTGTPPRHDRTANGGHEAGEGEDTVSLAGFLDLLNPAPAKNVLAIQVHNIDPTSSDLSMLPRLVDRAVLPGSIENGDPNGVWTFRFNPAEHDTGPKVLFAGSPNEVRIPGGRTGADGVRDALDVIDTFVRQPSVAEFICLKLINKLVSDEISLATYKDGSAPEDLRRLMDDAIAAWNSTAPPGDIRTVLGALLSPEKQDGVFWSRTAFRTKVKTPMEFINSSVRALGAEVEGMSLAAENDRLGMHLFNRDDPDGWSELGVDWIDTGTLLARIQFVQDLSANRLNSVRWDTSSWALTNGLTSAEAIVEHFNHLLFQEGLAPANRSLLIQFATTDDSGNPLPMSPDRADFARRVRELVGLILSMPPWHYQ